VFFLFFFVFFDHKIDHNGVLDGVGIREADGWLSRGGLEGGLRDGRPLLHLRELLFQPLRPRFRGGKHVPLKLLGGGGVHLLYVVAEKVHDFLLVIRLRQHGVLVEDVGQGLVERGVGSSSLPGRATSAAPQAHQAP
jgi:hypothetical protein